MRRSHLFIPLGALLVDFTLTVVVRCAAGASALIAYLPDLEPVRTPIGLALVGLVAAMVLLGQWEASPQVSLHELQLLDP